MSHSFVVANNEHYRTTNVVSTPSSGQRTISVRLGSGFNSFFSPGLDASLKRYNDLNLKIRFSRVTTGGNLVISASNLGTSGGGCILGQASGFPSGGNPSSGFTLSNSSCANSFFNSSAKADEVIMHEIGHCIGFRHTDYTTRKSCGQNSNEGTAGIGAVFIPGTPTASQVTSTSAHWMMACTNGNPAITNSDVTALNYVY
jgi:Dual-action HEIGH metallo-peptidase